MVLRITHYPDRKNREQYVTERVVNRVYTVGEGKDREIVYWYDKHRKRKTIKESKIVKWEVADKAIF